MYSSICEWKWIHTAERKTRKSLPLRERAQCFLFFREEHYTQPTLPNFQSLGNNMLERIVNGKSGDLGLWLFSICFHPPDPFSALLHVLRHWALWVISLRLPVGFAQWEALTGAESKESKKLGNFSLFSFLHWCYSSGSGCVPLQPPGVR